MTSIDCSIKAEKWARATYPQTADRIKGSKRLQRPWHNTELLPAVFRSAHILRDIPGLFDLFWNIGSATGELAIIGLAHELIRLAQIHQNGDKVLSLGQQIEIPGHTSIAPDAIIKGRGVIEIKMCLCGLDSLPFVLQEQASRYATAMKAGLITGVRYVLSAPYVKPSAITSLAKIIPGVQVELFDSHNILDPNPRGLITTP